MEAYRSGGWLVQLDARGALTILRYEGREAWVRVPERVSKDGEAGEADGRVTAVGDGAFRGCAHLLGVVIPEGVIAVGASAFEDCRALQSVHLPESVKSIGARAFAGCESLEEVWLPEAVSELPDAAFRGCARLRVIGLQFVARIGAEAFRGCEALDPGCVSRTALRRSQLGPGAFRGCATLADEDGFAIIDGLLTGCRSRDAALDVPEGVKELDAGCFSGLDALEELILPDSLTAIRAGAFDGCPGLRRITAPGAITCVGGAVFHEETDALSPDPIAFERDEIDWKPFAVRGAGSFLVRSMQPLLPRNPWDMRFARTTDGLTVLRYFGGAAQIRIPDEWQGQPVTEIGPYAFAGLRVERVILPKGLHTIGAGAFAGDDRLKGVVFNDRLRHISAYAFAGCASLAGAAFGQKLERVDEGAFADCSSMRYALLPGGAVALADDAFERHVLLSGPRDAGLREYARRTKHEFMESEDAAGRVALDRYASYHMRVSDEAVGAERWAGGGEKSE